MNVVLISLGIINFLFAGVGWFYRYDAYLVALGIFIIALSLSEIKGFKFSISSRINRRNIAKYLLIVISFILIITLVSDPLESRGFESLKKLLKLQMTDILDTSIPHNSLPNIIIIQLLL